MILGPKFMENRHLAEKQSEYRAGLLDDYNCFLYIPPMPNAAGVNQSQGQAGEAHKKQFSYIKVRDIKKYMFEVYTEELYNQIDLEEFVKNEIETKAIVVIDEIDKLVRSPDSSNSTKASDEGVQYDLLPILDGTTVNVNQSK